MTMTFDFELGQTGVVRKLIYYLISLLCLRKNNTKKKNPLRGDHTLEECK